MKYQAKVKVLGMKSSKGQLENGTVYDSTKVYLVVDMDTSKGNAVGQAAAEFNMGDSTMIEAYRKLPYPFDATGEFELVSNGKVSKTVCHGITPVSQAKQQ